MKTFFGKRVLVVEENTIMKASYLILNEKDQIENSLRFIPKVSALCHFFV